MARNSGRFHFDGGAATYVGTAILGLLITVFTLGICYPFALVLNQRWRAKHSYIDGRRLTFTGTGIGLSGPGSRWFLLIVITIGIYAFWVGPRIARWKWEHTDFDPTWRPNTLDQSQRAVENLSPVAHTLVGLCCLPRPGTPRPNSSRLWATTRDPSIWPVHSGR